MPKMTNYAPGRFCWADLATTDQEGAKKFYSALFGWEYRDNPAREGISYSMALQQGSEVAALYRMHEGERQKGIHSHWRNYLSVASADASADKAKALGATLLAPPFDVFDYGRMAVFTDPGGAVLSIWEPRHHFGAALTHEPGSLCWHELATGDPEEARNFYSTLFGWTDRSAQPGGRPYTIFSLEGKDEAGMLPLPGECEGTHPYWMIYFQVEECDRSLEKAQAAGGRIVKQATDLPSIGRYCVIQDPQGASLGLFEARTG